MTSLPNKPELPQRGDQTAGWSLAIGAAISILFMLLHPEVNTKSHEGALNELIRESPLSRIVHGSLIVTLVVILASVERVAARLSATGVATTLGLAFYRLGTLTFILAALISGFIVTDLGLSYSMKSVAEQAVFFDLARLTNAINQVLSKVGSVFYGITALLWGLSMSRSGGMLRLAGLASAAIGLLIMAAILHGLKLNVHGMTLIVVGLALWQGLMAYLSLKTKW